jgi:hypothetical protein
MRAGAAGKRKIGRPRLVDDGLRVSTRPEPWDNTKTAAAVRGVLDSFEDVPAMDADVAMTLQRWMWRRDRFGEDGRGHITAILRIFLESDVNRDALIDPILRAVSFAQEQRFARHGLALLDAMDTIKLTELLATMRGLDLFAEKSLSHYMSLVLRNRITKILEPLVPKPAKVKAKPIPPLSVSRVPAIEKSIELVDQI